MPAGCIRSAAFPAWHRWAEWNGRYRDDLRSFLKGRLSGNAWAAAQRITGSRDLYPIRLSQGGDNASVNFLTCHDGFTLYDLYSYNEKHNEGNGWNNTDGCNDNRSWNCGAEGRDRRSGGSEALRYRMIRNACRRAHVQPRHADVSCRR